jgi:predicted nucleotidyltransferase component of viral defense system
MARGLDPARLQQQVAFERFLARLAGADDWVLKGGFALQLRYGLLTRPTRDIDLRTVRSLQEALGRLRRAVAESTTADQFTFALGEVGQELQGAPGGSLRVRVVARIAGVDLSVFHVDLSSGDALVAAPEMLRGSDLLAFAGLPPVEFPVYPVEQHLAEKLHAYTLPRQDENTRVKDLVDLAYIAGRDRVDGDHLTAAVQATFDARTTHPLPARLPEPPDSWTRPFARIAAEVPGGSVTDLPAGFALAAGFWDPLLGGQVAGRRWSAAGRRWEATA